MKSSTIKIIFCVAIFLSIISIGVQEDSIADILNNMSDKGQSIYRIFKPTKQGYLGKGVYGVAYKGILLLNGMEVAMKFTSISDKKKADCEYKIYTYLNAINNPNVEAFGIPAIYYYGTWNDYILMALTLLDKTFHERFYGNKFNKMDFLIMVREYVRITKYMHSRCVFQRDFKLQHMMFRKNMGFLYDFNVAIDGTNSTRQDKLLVAQYDWKQFFFEMRLFAEKHQDWLGFNKKKKDDARRLEFENFIPGLLEDSKTPEKFNGMRRIFIDFVKYAYDETDEVLEIPFYDLMYQTVVEEIAKLQKEQKIPAVLSWLSTADKNAAILAKDSIPSISEIRSPFGADKVEFKEVNLDFFNEFYYNKLNAESDPEPELEPEPTPEPKSKSKRSILKFWKK